MKNKVNIAIFASGGGSNAQAIMDHFKGSELAQISLVVTNNSDAGVIERANNMSVPTYVHKKNEQETSQILSILEEFGIELIVLAGYMKKIGPYLLKAYPDRIVNVHPALLPKFGGQGMYGMNVHHAVVAAGEKISGPTFHFVNEHYDEGAIIAQYEVELEESDSADEVQKKVLKLEHQYYPQVVEDLIKQL